MTYGEMERDGSATTRTRYLTTSEAARHLGLSRYTVLRAVARGEIAVAGRTPAGWARFEAATIADYAHRLRATGPAARRAHHGATAPRSVRVAAGEQPEPEEGVQRARAQGADEEEGVHGAEERYRALVEHATDLIAVVDAQGAICYASPSYRRVLGYDPAVLMGTSAADLAHPDDRAGFLAGMRQRALEPGSTGGMEVRVRHADGSWRVLDVTTANRLHDPAVRGLITTARDVTERVQAEAALRTSEERYRRIVETAQEGIWEIDAQDRTAYVNRRMADLLGYGVEEMIGQPLTAFRAPEDHAAAAEGIEGQRQGAIAVDETRCRRKDGSILWVRLAANPLFDADGRYSGSLAMITDITARKQVEDLLQQQALHDPLTGLPNRALLHDRLGQALTGAAREQAPLAFCLLDLDRFKEVNGTLGHDAGDALLHHVADRLRGALRASDTVARLGGAAMS